LFIENSNAQAITETLPFENYRNNHSSDGPINNFLPQSNIVSNRNNNNYGGANRLSDDEDEQEVDVDEEEDNEREEDDDDDDHAKRKNNGQNFSQQSRQSHMIGDSFSRNIPLSSFVNPSTKLMMMMKGNGDTGTVLGGTPTSRNGKSGFEQQRAGIIVSSGSPSSSSSLPVDEQQQHIKPLRYSFVPAPFNGTRLIAKSTEQLNRSYPNDSLENYCPPKNISSFQLPTKTNSPTSILKQNFHQKYTPSTMIQSSSKEKSSMCINGLHAVYNRLIFARIYLFPFHHHHQFC
jgi:hypothetical protein